MATVTIKKRYNYEIENQSESYEVFDFIVRNFNSLVSSQGCPLELILEQFGKDEMVRRVQRDEVKFVEFGEEHLFCIYSTVKWRDTLCALFKMLISGESHRTIAEKLHLSLSTVKRIRFIAINTLAREYTLIAQGNRAA